MNRIAELRKEKHLNQVGLAVKLNVSQYTVSAYETGRQQPTADMIINMADFFNVSTDYLLGRSEIRHKADEILGSNLSEKELQIISFAKSMSIEKQDQAIGLLFALKNMNQ